MTATIVPIRKGLTPEAPLGTVDEHVVRELQDMLDRAKSGEITGVAYVALCPGDTTYYGRIGRMTRGALGAIEILKYELCREDSGRS